ncbi:MAG TPA: vitamin-B12 independent methionine synthase [Pirellulales bacterium]|nr:vitamin-B12 independent methionine synthase [Pirellulales bacterium]
MNYDRRHAWPARASFDGGTLDCGNGLLLLIRQQIDALQIGELLELKSQEPSVEEDLPAWCRMTKNDLVSCVRDGHERSFLISKGPFKAPILSPVEQAAGAGQSSPAGPRAAMPLPRRLQPVVIADRLPNISPAPAVRPLSVMGIGSWPRPKWMLQAIHEHVAGRLPEDEFREIADDAVRLSVASQERAGVDLVTDGEQCRDSYASFVGGILDNCQLIPVTDLLSYVDDAAEFERELRTLDVPAETVRHPAVFGPLGRSRPLAVDEARFVMTISDRPVKVALPGPYLLTRTMWMECISDRAYATREALAEDVVRVLREELFDLLALGVAMVQFDEPVLTEVVFHPPRQNRTFMCGALGAKRDPQSELSFALELINRVVQGVPTERTALHICRGNWSRDESVALTGSYVPLLPLLREAAVGTLMLELCTPRAGELEVLQELPERLRIGVGVVNPKSATVESIDEIAAKAQRAVELFGLDRVLLNPDCGFATFADNPVNTAEIAERKLANIARSAAALRNKHGLV